MCEGSAWERMCVAYKANIRIVISCGIEHVDLPKAGVVVTLVLLAVHVLL